MRLKLFHTALFFFVVFSVATAIGQQQARKYFTIKGSSKSNNGIQLWLTTPVIDRQIDSIVGFKSTNDIFTIEADSFSFGGYILDSFPMPLQIAWLPNGEDQIMFSDVFFVDSGSYKIRLDSLVNIPHISISPVVSFNAEMKQIVRHLSLAADSVKYKLTLLNEYVTQYPTSYPALWSLASLYSRFSYVGEMDLVLNILSKEFSSHNLYRYLEQQFAIRRELIHGAVFPFNTLAYGKQIKDLVPLARYTLIEFWATWCSPCIAQIPEWKRLYNETDRKTLNIIGIALEQPSNHAGLKKFIKKEHVKWANITDWRGIESDKLGIKSIPFNILLDHDGIIVDLNILPEALKKLLLFQVR